jgi:hypothetical protein
MTRVFADAVYWVALASPHDQWHGRAVQASRALGTAQIISTEEVFVEFLAHFSGYGRLARAGATLYFDTVINDAAILVRPQSHQSFLDGYALYKARLDNQADAVIPSSVVARRPDTEQQQAGIRWPVEKLRALTVCPRLRLLKECRRRYHARIWNERCWQQPEYRRQIRCWQAARRQARRRQGASAKDRHAL